MRALANLMDTGTFGTVLLTKNIVEMVFNED